MSSQSPTIRRVFDVILERARTRPESTLLACRPGDEWLEMSAIEALEQINGFSVGLLELGVEPGDRVGCLSTNRPEWNCVDLGSQQIGAVVVPLFPKMSAESYRHVLEETRPEVLFVENEKLRDKVLPAAEGIVDERRILLFDDSSEAQSWTRVHGRVGDEECEEIVALRDEIEPDRVATIIYTSGSTGPPKGVPLTHENLVSNLLACAEITPVGEGRRSLSVLPLSHVFERQLNWVYMHLGVAVYYARDVDLIAEDMRDVAPHVFTAVPRLLQKSWEAIEARGRRLQGIRRRIFHWAVGVADDFELQGNGVLYRLKHRVADRLVYSKWRQGFGGEVMVVISGGASLTARLNRRLTAAGIDVLEGYGLTETSPVLTVNRWERSRRRFGSVGLPVDGVRLQIADDDEILAKGPNVFSGYHDNREATEAAFDEEGWFRTGDLGRIDEDGFVWVEDRKKSAFKTSGGKYVAPAPIEDRLTESALVEHAMVVGEDRKMVTALIQPEFGNLEDWCRDHDLEPESRDEMVEMREVRDRFQEIVDEANEGLDHTAQIKRFGLVPDEWSPESGELTPTLKIRREAVREKYAERVEALYRD